MYDITNGSFSYVYSLDKQDCRILSLSWHPSLSLIVAGCSDSTVRILDTETHHCTLRITVEKSEQQDTLVWCVKYLSNDTIISSTSLGKINIWNAQFGTLKQAFGLHVADILALAINETEDVMFAAGVDHKIVRFKKVSDVESGETWVQSQDVRPHTHDVKALAVSRNGILASGGVDTELCINLIEKFHKVPTTRYSPFTSWSNRFKLACSGNLLLFQGTDSLKLWKISSKADSHTSSSNGCSPDKDAIRKLGVESMESDLCLASGLPACLLEIKAGSSKHIISSAISDNGRKLGFSDVDNLWLYHIDVGVVCIGTWKVAAIALAFNVTGSHVVVCLTTGGVKIGRIADDSKEVEFEKLPVKDKKSKKGDLMFYNAQYSPCEKYLIVMNELHQFYLYNASNYSVISTLTCIDGNSPPLLTFIKGKLLMFSGTYGELYSYSLKSTTLKSIGHVKRIKSHFNRKGFAMAKGLSVLVTRPDVCVLYDYDTLMFINYKENTSTEDKGSGDVVVGKKRKSEEVKYLSFDIAKDISDIVYVGMLNCGELVVVEKPWTDVIANLPPTIRIDRYGT